VVLLKSSAADVHRLQTNSRQIRNDPKQISIQTLSIRKADSAQTHQFKFGAFRLLRPCFWPAGTRSPVAGCPSSRCGASKRRS